MPGPTDRPSVVDDLPDEVLEPFELEAQAQALDDLRTRLEATRWPPLARGSGWSRGVPLEELRRLVAFWLDDYDWRAEEVALNRHPQFVTRIDGARVHFLHIRSPEPDAVPVVMTHGWPSSVVEFLDVVGPLTDPRHHGADPSPAVHLVLPHIPGFALSGPLDDTGWTVHRIALAWAELMRRLGYDRYVAQGGDWGHAISLELAAVAPEHVRGVHVNTLVTPPPDNPDNIALLDDGDRERLDRVAAQFHDMSAYAHLQATRPATLAYALTDSPAGQLAWIAEKFHEWSDPDSTIPPSRLITNVMLYWLTATAASSAALYAEPYTPPAVGEVPIGVAVFGKDLAAPVRSLAERHLNIVHWGEHERGGHFPALEQPDEFVADLRSFLGRLD